jgi:hypothetical protein
MLAPDIPSPATFHSGSMNEVGTASWLNRSITSQRCMKKCDHGDRVVTKLIGRVEDETDFYLVERLHGLSTTVREHAERAKAAVRLRLGSRAWHALHA